MERMKYILLIGTLCCMMSCQQANDKLLTELDTAKAQIAQLQEEVKGTSTPVQKVMTHTLYFNLKKDLTKEQIVAFEKGLRSLSTITAAKEVKVGKSAKTEDVRLISNYDYVLTMYFKNDEDLQTYSHDDFHMKVRAEIGPMLEKAPIVYDSWVD
jgi:septal ring factor EnvC (AmiA/AmiB activator)